VSFDDVQLAIQSRVNYSFTQPPPKEVRIEMARVFFFSHTEDAAVVGFVSEQCAASPCL